MQTGAPGIAPPGFVLAGKLRVERLIGQGAMGVVYEATDITLRRRVAVKLVHPDHLGDPEKRLRFGREAYAVARLESIHVTRVLEISELDDGTPYLVMELLDGSTLDEILARSGPAQVHVALDWILQALDAVGEAHAIGLVHRDLKPANLYLARHTDGMPIVKVIDFGLVKDMSAAAPKLTATGSTMGSPAYMAPEQIDPGRTIDARTDVWSIGVTLFELVTGTLPFDGESIPAMLRRIFHDDPTPLRARRPDAPAELEEAVAKCLAKDPDARFRDGADLRRALSAIRARLPQVSDATKTVRLSDSSPLALAPPAMVVPARPRVGSVPTVSTREPGSSRRTAIIATLVSAIVVGGVLVGVLAMMQGRRKAAMLRPAPPATSAPATSQP